MISNELFNAISSRLLAQTSSIDGNYIANLAISQQAHNITLVNHRYVPRINSTLVVIGTKQSLIDSKSLASKWHLFASLGGDMDHWQNSTTNSTISQQEHNIALGIHQYMLPINTLVVAFCTKQSIIGSKWSISECHLVVTLGGDIEHCQASNASITVTCCIILQQAIGSHRLCADICQLVGKQQCFCTILIYPAIQFSAISVRQPKTSRLIFKSPSGASQLLLRPKDRNLDDKSRESWLIIGLVTWLPSTFAIDPLLWQGQGYGYPPRYDLPTKLASYCNSRVES